MPVEAVAEEGVAAVEEEVVVVVEKPAPAVAVAVRARNLRSHARVQNLPVADQSRRAVVVDVCRNPVRVEVAETGRSKSPRSALAVGVAGVVEIGHRGLVVVEAQGCRVSVVAEMPTGRRVRIVVRARRAVGQIVRTGPTIVRVAAIIDQVAVAATSSDSPVEEVAVRAGGPDRIGQDKGAGCVLEETEDGRERFQRIARGRGRVLVEEGRNGDRVAIIVRAQVFFRHVRELAAVVSSGVPETIVLATDFQIARVVAAMAHAGRISVPTTDLNGRRGLSARPNGRTSRTRATISGTSGNRTTTSTLTTSRRTG